MREELKQIIREIRSSKIDNKNGSIKGECKRNAKFLKQKLEERGYESHIIKGAINYEKEPKPTSYSEAKSCGRIHHWVLVKLEDSEFHCDICMEVSSYQKNERKILCSRELPPHYIKF